MTKPRQPRYLNATANALYTCRNISTVDKLLAYKIFLRPKLIFEWYNNCNSKLKVAERKALKRIFDASRHYGGINKQYSDLDVTDYVKLQELKWRRATNLNVNQLRKLLKSFDNEKGNTENCYMKSRYKRDTQE